MGLFQPPIMAMIVIADSPSTWTLVLWGGLAVLTIALVILMMTRWGQARPVSKCMALSVFAHILLATYAYGTRWLDDVPSKPPEETIQLAAFSEELVMDEELNPAKSAAPNEFEKFASSPSSPSPIELAPQPMGVNDDLPLPKPTSNPSSSTPQPDVVPTFEPIEEPSPVAPVPLASQAATESPVHEAAEATPIQPMNSPDVARESVARAEATVPDLVRPDRIAESPVENQLEAMQSPDPASNLAELSAEIQRLTDPAVMTEVGEALPDTEDVLHRSSPDRQQMIEINKLDQLPLRPSPQRREVADAPNDSELMQIARVPKRAADGQVMPRALQWRTAQQVAVRRFGGTEASQVAVREALKWLASVQLEDGRWDADQWGAGNEQRVLGHDRNRAGAKADTGVTALALLAFLGAGQSHFEGEYRQNVQAGLEYLLRSQAGDGNLSGDAQLFARMYCHSMATLAISEALALSGDYRLRPAVERAVRYTTSAQDRSSGGWRYQPGDAGDMSQFGWKVMALHSAKLGGIEIPGESEQGMQRFLNKCRAGRHGGLAGYQPGHQASAPMTAEALASHIFLGVDQAPAARQEAIEMLRNHLPSTESVNLYYWYYGTIAAFQVQGELWEQWNQALLSTLVGLQEAEGELAGSWSPDTVWGSYGGRVYSTAIATLSLEVYYRYLPMFQGR